MADELDVDAPILAIPFVVRADGVELATRRGVQSITRSSTSMPRLTLVSAAMSRWKALGSLA